MSRQNTVPARTRGWSRCLNLAGAGLGSLIAFLVAWLILPIERGSKEVVLPAGENRARNLTAQKMPPPKRRNMRPRTEHRTRRTDGEAHDVLAVVIQLDMHAGAFESPETFSAWVRHPLDNALRQIPEDVPVLAVYPEYCGIGLLFHEDSDLLADTASFDEAVRALATRHAPGVLRRMVRRRVGAVRGLLLTRVTPALVTYLETFSSLAAEHNLVIAAGSMLTPPCTLHDHGRRVEIHREGAKLYNAAFVFGPDGELLGWQPKVHLTEFEGRSGLDLTPGRPEDAAPVNTPVGSIGLAVCFDAFHENHLEHVTDQGVQILVQPSANPGPWTRNQQEEWMQSAWHAAQKYRDLRCVLNPMMTGRLMDVAFEGQSAITAHKSLAPTLRHYRDLPATPGFVAIARYADKEDVLVAPLPARSAIRER